MKGFSKKTLALLCAIVLIASASTALAISYLTIPGTGHIHVITPASLTVGAGNLAFGTFNSNAGPQTKTVTLTNNGDMATTALSMAVSGLPTGVSLTWDANGKTIAAHSSLDTLFTLTNTVTSDVDLSFNVVISGA
jgi:hypothetical protein